MNRSKVRIYQLSKQLSLDSKDILAVCAQLNITAKSHSSTVSRSDAERILTSMRQTHPAANSQKPLKHHQDGLGSGVSSTQSLPQQSLATQFPADLDNPQYYFNRELSWLAFNERVLHEALDPRTPLLERLKFLAIFSTNLDEYFMVRVAVLKQQVELQVSQTTSDGLSPQAQLDAIQAQLQPVVEKQHRHFAGELRPQLAAKGIHILDYDDLHANEHTYLQQYFEAQIFPVLTPLAVDPSHPFPYISNLSLNLAVVVQDTKTGEEHFARLKVPKVLPRFIPLAPELGPPEPDQPLSWRSVPLEQVIAHNLEALFPGMNIQEYYPFRVTRNADLEIEEDEADDLLLAMEQELRKRRFGSAVRLEIQVATPEAMRQMLMRELALVASDVYEVEGLLSLSDLMELMGLPLADLKYADWSPVVPPRIQKLEQLEMTTSALRNGAGILLPEFNGEEQEDIFSLIRKGDLLVHHPYDSFSATVQRFITQAAHDPHVLAIKMTLYRTSGDASGADSPIVNALIAAAENGKQVVALVELKARFDEANNILWARKFEKVGVHVVYGMVGLKTHTKIALVVRQESGQIHRYVHIGTGNYNPKTAKLYTDLGLLSCREDLGADLTDLFNYLTGYSRQQSYRKLLVAPVNFRDRMLALIHRETKHQLQGGQGQIIAKMNSLVDQEIIAALYEASQAGVQIDLVIRGICCLRPGIQSVSENIRVISVIGRFLEHSRIFYFFNQGQPEVFIGSADWRSRNLDRRVEAVVPVVDLEIAQQLKQILAVMLADNRQAWELQPDGRYIQRHPASEQPELGSQQILMDLALQSASGT